MDLVSAAHELLARDDEGEVRYVEGHAAYLHEALGLADPSGPTAQTFSDQDAQYDRAVAKVDGFDGVADTRPFYRSLRYGGYLGQGGYRSVQLPPPGGSRHRHGDPRPAPTVFVESLGLAGDLFVGSARSFTFVKRNSLPSPVERWPAEHPEGDDARAGGYKAAGIHGSGPEHKVKALEPPPGADRPDLLRAAGVLDWVAYSSAWQAGHPFRYHEKDFDTPDDGAGRLGRAVAPLDFSKVRDGGPVPLPPAVPVKVDHRYGEVDYYPNESGFAHLPGGEVTGWDGFGGDDTRAGGDRQIAVPGTLYLTAGRAVVISAPQVIIKGQDSVDVSSAEGTVVMKAELDFRILGGNSGRGGVLVESRSVGLDQNNEKPDPDRTTGIVIKAPSAVTAIDGLQVYVRSLGGDVMLDASKGDGAVRSEGYEVVAYVTNTFSAYFGPRDRQSEVSSIFRYAPGGSFIDSQLFVGGGITCYEPGPVLVLGDVLAAGSLMCDGVVADHDGGFVLKVPGGFRAIIEEAAARAKAIEQEIETRRGSSTGRPWPTCTTRTGGSAATGPSAAASSSATPRTRTTTRSTAWPCSSRGTSPSCGWGWPAGRGGAGGSRRCRRISAT
jgi:hypothetical protein